MAERRIKVTQRGHADRWVRRAELADHLAAGWFPVWDQSLETLSTQVTALREGLVDLAGTVEALGGADPGGGGPPPGGGDGKSAYELAVDNGFQGTVQQWLASLEGPQGDPGDDGAAGTDGSDGPPGADGKSAYQLARDQGYGGTLTQWIASLKGDPGTPGAPGADSTVPGPSGTGFATLAKVASDQPFTTTTLANVTGLSFPAAANTAYRIDALLAITSAALTTGWQFGFTGPASPTSFLAVQEYQSAVTGWTTATLTGFGAFTLVTAAYAIAPTQILVRINGLLVNGSNAGTVQLQCRSEVASSAITVKRGSTLLVS